MRSKRVFARVVLAALIFLAGGGLQPTSGQASGKAQSAPAFPAETTEDYNRRLAELRGILREHLPAAVANEYRIGAEDLLEISVFEAPELNRSLRVSASGEVSMPLLGAVRAAGLTPRELEFVLQELLRRTYMKDPHVGVHVREMQSHPVSVFGAVKKPGVFQIRGTKSLIEVLSLAEGLAEDAGDTVLVMRGECAEAAANPSAPNAAQPRGSDPDPASCVAASEVNLKALLESGDPRYNLAVYPGDTVKVTRAGIVYVIGEVRKPGGFLLRSNENISVLQAIALGEGLTRTAARRRVRVIHTDRQTGQRTETPVDLSKVLAGKATDPLLAPNDIVFVPGSAVRGAFYRGAEVGLATVSGVVIFRR